MDSKPDRESPDVMRELILESHLEFSNSGITVIDVNENVVYWNKRFFEIWGLEEEAPAGQNREKSVSKVVDKLVCLFYSLSFFF